MAVYYCSDHMDFEGLDLGKLHDHIERDHPEIRSKEQIAEYFRSKLTMEDFRRSDGKMVARSWGRVPKLGNFMGANEIDKK
jgi:hypothetical protein